MRLFKNVILWASFIVFVTACINKNKMESIKVARPVPVKYFRITNPAFSVVQDTVFYKGDLFSGYIYDVFPNGDTSLVAGYLQGEKEGLLRKWYPNGQLSEQRLYIAGHKEGIHRGWWENGKPKFIFQVSNDEYTGFFKDWYANGKLARFFHYKDGQEDGNEKMWWPDGTIRANYVIVNGQKFGLFGQQLCINSLSKVGGK